MGRTHVAAFAALPEVNVASICDADVDRLAEVQREFAVAHATPDVAELLATDIDAVVVATPEHLHLDATLAALRAGKHVLVEKPFATDVAEAHRMANEARDTGLLVMPAHLLRYEPKHRMVKDWLDAGSRGELISLYLRRNRPASLFEIYSRIHPAFELTSHDTDLALWYVGRRVDRVYAVHRQRPDERNPHGFWAIAEFDGGTIATFEAVWSTVDEARLEFGDLCEVIAENGTAHVNIANPGITFWDEAGQTSPDPVYGTSSLDVVPLAVHREVEDFVECLRGIRAAPQVSLHDAVHGIEVIDAMIRSAEKRLPVELDPDGLRA
jgi:predicted dehydrogenase